MKTKNLTWILFLSLFVLNSSIAQPLNDKACDALSITLDEPATIVSNIDATADPGEAALMPSPEIINTGNCYRNVWKDGLLLHSLWFKFTAPASTAVHIDLCGSNFDSQMILFEVGDCANFNTYRLLQVTDDNPSCGDGLSGTLRIECLTPGEEYYVLVDDSSPETSSPVDTGNIAIVITTAQKTDPGLAGCGPVVRYPRCPGAAEGAFELTLISGVCPIEFRWSNGDTIQDISGLVAGEYTVTITDFCQSSMVATFDIEDPTSVEPLTFANFPNEVVQPSYCGDGATKGQISVAMDSGVGPFKYEWSNGDSLAYLNNLDNDNYTVTVTDHCDLHSLVKEYQIGASAGPDIDLKLLGENCREVNIGLDQINTGGNREKFTYNTDQSFDSGIACRGGGFIAENDTWRAWDLANDFGLSGTVNLSGVEVFITSTPNPNYAQGVRVKFTAYLANTRFLDDEDLQLTLVDEFETIIPEVSTYTSYIAPLNGLDLSADKILVIKVSTLERSGDGHRFDFAANTSPTSPPSATYITSADCNLNTPHNLANLGDGFEEQIIMNLILREGQKGLTYLWDSPYNDLDDPTQAIQTVSLPGTYPVTITDQECGLTFIDEVVYDCWGVVNALEDLDNASINIFPNPSNGLFQMTNKSGSQKTNIQVFDLQGKLVYFDWIQWSNSEIKTLNIKHLVQSTYFAKFTTEYGVETFKLILQ